jgi:hypothetical protein
MHDLREHDEDMRVVGSESSDTFGSECPAAMNCLSIIE